VSLVRRLLTLARDIDTLRSTSPNAVAARDIHLAFTVDFATNRVALIFGDDVLSLALIEPDRVEIRTAAYVARVAYLASHERQAT
jgi:hypothetical protein